MKNYMKEINEKNYWVLLCDEIVCGVFSTKKDAKEYNSGLEGCPVRHKIKKCEIKIKIGG